MSDNSRAALFGALAAAGVPTKLPFVRHAVVALALSEPGQPKRTVTTFTTLTDDDVTRVLNRLPAIVGRVQQTSAVVAQP